MKSEHAIKGVIIRNIETHADDRGFFREILRCNSDDGSKDVRQVSHSLVFTGIVKAWHGHMVQTQWNYVLSGLVRVALCDMRKDSPTYRRIMEFLAGDHQAAQVYGFPPGVLHGYRCIQGPMHIIYLTSGTYNLQEELRVAHDDPEIQYDWREDRKIR